MNCFIKKALCEIDLKAALTQNNLLAIYKGQLAEQFVAQEMLAWQDSNLFYWVRDSKSSNAEVDFITVCDGEIYPIEVKSGAGGSLTSLHLLLKAYPNCAQGIVLYSGTYRKLPEQKLIFMPLYCSASICNT